MLVVKRDHRDQRGPQDLQEEWAQVRVLKDLWVYRDPLDSLDHKDLQGFKELLRKVYLVIVRGMIYRTMQVRQDWTEVQVNWDRRVSKDQKDYHLIDHVVRNRDRRVLVDL